MICVTCNNLGVFSVNYQDGSPTDYAVCLCHEGESLRSVNNNSHAHVPLYHVWASRHGISIDRVFPMEDILTDEEMRAKGFTELTVADAVSPIIAAANSRSMQHKGRS